MHLEDELPRLPNSPGRPSKSTLQQRLRARTLYFSGKTHAEIAKLCGFESEQYSQRLISNEGWRALKLAQDPESQAIIAEAKKRAKECLAEWQQEISAGSQEMSLSGIELARDKLERGDARGLKDAASAVKTFVDITRQAEGLGSDTGSTGDVNVSMFFLASPEKPMVRVTEIDVEPTSESLQSEAEALVVVPQPELAPAKPTFRIADAASVLADGAEVVHAQAEEF